MNFKIYPSIKFKMEDPYLVLGISKSATSGEIKAAFQALARKWHPDKNPGLQTVNLNIFKDLFLTVESHSKKIYERSRGFSTYERGFKIHSRL